VRSTCVLWGFYVHLTKGILCVITCVGGYNEGYNVGSSGVCRGSDGVAIAAEPCACPCEYFRLQRDQPITSP
jgi:hypothetical protein